DRDESDHPLKCKKCEAIAEKLSRENPSVWTLQLKYDRPKRVEVKRELKEGSEVYWYIYYEIKNIDKIDRPCFIDVMAESDKGKNQHWYHDHAVPEVVAELRKILAIKDDEVLHTQVELTTPNKGEANQLPNKDGTVRGGEAKLALPSIKPGETKRCVAIFPKFDNEMDVLTVYFHGLCNTIAGIPSETRASNFPSPHETVLVDGSNPETSPVAEGEGRLIADDAKNAGDYKRKVIDRVYAIEYECPGDEFAKSVRSIPKHEEQTLRPKNLARYPDDPVKYHDVGVFGTEIIEPEEKQIEGKKASPFTFLARKWIQVERTIKSDLK
ncbi:hypothetical protein HY251_15060, partial [bacterium]|nr:hypothetical protein [bacterium]